jgi:uncharacterized membrane protein YraQ (UPF0718 family)
MAQVKKVFAPIMAVLAANMGEKVKKIYPEIEALVNAKSGGGGQAAFHKNEAGELVALHCSYHKKWFKPSEVEFGAKASSASGFNTMCKDGMSKWTKQLSAFKKAKEKLLEDVGAGLVAASDIASITAQLEEEREVIVPLEIKNEAGEVVDTIPGYDTLEELLATL